MTNDWTTHWVLGGDAGTGSGAEGQVLQTRELFDGGISLETQTMSHGVNNNNSCLVPDEQVL